MIDIPLLREAMTLGLGALIAVITLIWKRADDLRYAKALEDMNRTLLTALDANTRAVLGVQTAVEAQADRRQQEQEMRELREMIRQQQRAQG
jgi:hypothetical protein